MLSWFRQEGHDPDATGSIEPPETPAPVFAVRAFKHAIFGTPGTVQPKALRRHSNTENGKPRPNARPAITRPKSSNDTQTLGAYDNAVAPDAEPLPSPTKGILMTPGTAAARRKTVSFGNQVKDNEGKRQGKSGLPDDCPGKFPSPWVKPSEAADGNSEAPAEKTRGRNKLTEKLEQVRDESAKRKSVSNKQHPAELAKEVEESLEIEEQDVGYLKLLFEQYRERSERECRKLIAKQRAAKSFAREKDTQCLEMADQLRQEKKKVDRLEKEVAALKAQLKEHQEQPHASQAEEQKVENEAIRVKRGSGLSGYRRHGEYAVTASSRAQGADNQERETTLKSRRSKEELNNVKANDVKGASVGASDTAPARSRPRTRRAPKTEEEVPQRPPPAAASTLIPTKSDLPPPSRTSRTNTSTSPLKSLEINTLPQESISVALSMGMQPPSPQRETRADSPMRSPTRSRPNFKDSLSVMIPDSSSFLPDAEDERPNVLTGTPVPVKSPIRTRDFAVEGSSTLTPSVPRRRNRENVDPKASVKAPAVEKVEIGTGDAEDALKAEARAEARRRLTANGRQFS